MATIQNFDKGLMYRANQYLDVKLTPKRTYSELEMYPPKQRFAGLMMVVTEDEQNNNHPSLYILDNDKTTWIRQDTCIKLIGAGVSGSRLEGVGVVDKDVFEGLGPDRANKIWFVYDPTNETPRSVYFGADKFGELNDPRDLDTLSSITRNILSSIGQSVDDKDGTWIGFGGVGGEILAEASSVTDALIMLENGLITALPQIQNKWETKNSVNNPNQLPETGVTDGVVYYVERTDDFYVYYRNAWHNVSNSEKTKYYSGSGITIDTANKISSNAEGITTQDLVVNGGAIPSGVYENDVIPSGTTVQNILENLAKQKQYPSASQKPAIAFSGVNKTVMTALNTAISWGEDVTMNPIEPVFDPLVCITNQTQPQPIYNWMSTKLTWTCDGLGKAGLTPTGTTTNTYKSFDGVSAQTVGIHTITITGERGFTSPSNSPINNFGENESKTSFDDDENLATWTSGKTSEIIGTLTAIIPYLCYTNVSANTMVADTQVALPLESGNTVVVENIPSEITSNTHFEFYYPSGRNCQFKTTTIGGNYVDYQATYTESETTINGVPYIKLTTTGPRQGATSYKFIMDINLIES